MLTFKSKSIDPFAVNHKTTRAFFQTIISRIFWKFPLSPYTIFIFKGSMTQTLNYYSLPRFKAKFTENEDNSSFNFLPHSSQLQSQYQFNDKILTISHQILHIKKKAFTPCLHKMTRVRLKLKWTRITMVYFVTERCHDINCSKTCIGINFRDHLDGTCRWWDR